MEEACATSDAERTEWIEVRTVIRRRRWLAVGLIGLVAFVVLYWSLATQTYVTAVVSSLLLVAFAIAATNLYGDSRLTGGMSRLRRDAALAQRQVDTRAQGQQDPV